MDTTLDQKQTDPRHVLTARADEELAHAYSQITRAGEEIARAEEQLSKLERAGRRAAAARRPSRGGRAVRGLIGLTLAACICVAAVVGTPPTAMRPGRLSQVGRHSLSQLPPCRWKNRGCPRSRARLPFRRTRRRRRHHNRRLWRRARRTTSRRRRPLLPCRPT